MTKSINTTLSRFSKLLSGTFLSESKEAMRDKQGPSSWRIIESFLNEKASRVSSASQIDDIWDARVDWPILSWCLDMWAAIAASNESQLKGIWWTLRQFSAIRGSMQLSLWSWDTPESRSPTLMLVRVSAHSPADRPDPLVDFNPSWIHKRGLKLKSLHNRQDHNNDTLRNLTNQTKTVD